MRFLTKLAAALAAGMLTCAPAAAQKISDLPAAATLTGNEKVPAIQGTGCATHAAPCSNVALTVAQLATLAGSASQPLDSDLTAIAALATQPFGRSLLTTTDAASATSQFNVFTSSLKGLTPPSGGGTTNFLRADGTWAAPPSGGGAGGTVTSVSVVNANGISGSVATSTTTPAITLSLGAITPTSVASSGAVSGTTGTFSGAVTGSNIGPAAGQAYSEGTFTPTLQFGGGSTGIAYNTQIGRYTKVGRLVVVELQIGISSKGSSTGNAAIGGMPFSAGTVSGMSPLLASGLSGAPVPVAALVGTGLIYLYNGGNSFSNLTDANFSAGSSFYIVVTFTL